MSKAAYEKAYSQYLQVAAAAKSGDRGAFAAKADALRECRNIKRESARGGLVLNVKSIKGEKVQVDEKNTNTKRSLQEEYARRFDDKIPVNLGGNKPVTLQEYHRRRLLSK